jgi:hypothetical protein
MPTTKSPSNKRGKNDKKESNSNAGVISSSIKSSSNGKESSNSSSSNIHQDSVKRSESCKSQNSENKKKDVINCNGNTKTLNSFRTNKTEENKTSSDTLSNNLSEKITSSGGSARQPPTAKEELDSLANMLDFTVTYTNFPQKNKTDIVTLVKLTTNPPKVSILKTHFVFLDLK